MYTIRIKEVEAMNLRASKVGVHERAGGRKRRWLSPYIFA